MKRLNVTRERVLDLLHIINSSNSKKETTNAESELCELLSAVIDAKYQVEHYTDNYIMDYPYNRKICDIKYFDPYFLENCQLPEIIMCNASECYNFVFYTEWLDINLDKYFEKLQNETIRCSYISKKHLIENLKNINCKIERIKSCKINDLEFQIK